MSVGRTLNQAEPFQLKMTSEKASYEGEAVMVLIGNGPFLGGTRAMLGNSSFQDGLLDVFVIKKWESSRLWHGYKQALMRNSLTLKATLCIFVQKKFILKLLLKKR